MSDAYKPGETWLVVASTGAALVNLVAAAVTGLDRYDRILFLIGINPNGAGKRSGIEADRGYGRLLEALEHEARRIAVAWPKPNELIADMNDPSPWTAEVERFFGASGEGKAARHIVYVYTGGTKDMTVGCWDGFAALKSRRPNLTIELVSKQEERVFWPKEQRSVWLRGGGSHISVEGYLLASGYRILNAAECAARRAFALTHAEPLSGLGAALLGREDARRQQWVKLLNRLSQHNEAEVAPIAANLPAVDLRSFCSTLQPLLRALSDGGSMLKSLQRSMDVPQAGGCAAETLSRRLVRGLAVLARPGCREAYRCGSVTRSQDRSTWRRSRQPRQ